VITRKTKDQIALMRRAGKVVAEMHEECIRAATPGATTLDVDRVAREVIERLLGRGREDDTADSIRRRLELYDQETKPLIDLYDQRGVLVQVDGVGEEDAVFQRILDVITALDKLDS
jgi:adenylate kinase family enzyme